MKRLTKGAALLSIVAAASLAFAGCSPAAPAETSVSPGTPRTLTFWNNATTGPGKAHWEALAKSFEEKHPGVTVKIQNIQNEDWDGKLQTALNSPDAPDVFMQRGGEKMVEMIRADLIQPVTDAVTPEIKTALGEAAFEGSTYDGKIWAMTDLFQPGGIWYSEDLFKQAGITKTPETLDELFETVKTLKAAGITPIALGAKDAWPAAHWYYWFALRECKTESLEKAATDRDFTDPCWLKAGQDLADLKALEPFQDGLLTTPAQQGAGSSAGLIANHKAAMEVMGAWNAGVIGSLTPDEKPLPDLNWFPFPSVAGGQGAEGALMGGGGGYSCSKKAPQDLCHEFLQTIVAKEWQISYYKAFQVPPLNKDAQSEVTEPFNKSIMKAIQDATYTSDWLDTRLGQNVGNALNTGVVDMLAGKGDAQHIIDAVNDAAKKG